MGFFCTLYLVYLSWYNLEKKTTARTYGVQMLGNYGLA